MSTVRPVYEDRILVRWTPPPSTTGPIIGPRAASQRDSGPQYGIVVAAGKGATGRTKIKIDAKGQPYATIKPFKGGSVVPCGVEPGERVLYARREDQEFIDRTTGITHTFLFCEQDVLAVLD